MNVAVRTKVCLPEDLRAAAEQEVHRLARRVGGMDRAEVRFVEERAGRGSGHDCGVCEVTMHGHGHVVRARGAADDWSAAVDRTVGKLERQLERLRAKLSERAHAEHRISVHFPAHDSADIGPEEDEIPVVTTWRSGTRPLTPEEAALRMDLGGHDFYVFVNAENGSTGVVFRRTDGHIGLIDAG